MPLEFVSFKHISRILEVTDSLGLNREWVEIPLSPESPGVVRRLTNGKLEISLMRNNRSRTGWDRSRNIFSSYREPKHG